MSRVIPKTPTNPRQLRAIVILERAGFTPPEIMDVFHICRRTFFYRKREIRTRKPVAPA